MIHCATYGPMTRQRCVDNQLSIYDLWDFCGDCREGVIIDLPATSVVNPRHKTNEKRQPMAPKAEKSSTNTPRRPGGWG